MHVTTKEIVASEDDKKKYPSLAEGAHVLTSTIEGDGPNPIASVVAELSASVLSVTRTSSGGVEVKTAVTITEPAPVEVAPVVALAPPTAEESASAYLVSKGQSQAEADAQVLKFGAARILAARDKELDAQLQATLAKPEPPAEHTVQ